MTQRHRAVQSIIDTLTQDGPATSSVLCHASGISQATFSRLVRSLGNEILVTGRSRATRYAVPRKIGGVVTPIPVYEVRPAGQRARRISLLHPVRPNGYWVEDLVGGRDEFHEDIPWFLQDLRPAGFLGRQIPRRHPDLDAPPDIQHWSGDHALRYITRHGWDLPGAFIVGDAPYTTWLAQANRPMNLVDVEDRLERYPSISEAALDFGIPGSSAAGEQPKFLATRRSDGVETPVLVKFSPAGDDNPVSRRVADLLLAEHLALATLGDHGLPVARSVVLSAMGRTFLEVERFDRMGLQHRRGVCALGALDSAFVGSDRSSWTKSVEELVRQRRLQIEVLPGVRLLELFGRLIGNTDMHFGNLSFHLDGASPIGLAPAYDMLPMFYATRHGEISETLHPVPTPSPAWGDTALPAIAAAEDFWGRVCDTLDISEAFRRIGRENVQRTKRLWEAARHLPT